MLYRRITVLRRRANLSQAELAEKLNISASTEGMYEQGRRTPNVDILVLMARIFDVSLDYLITGSEYKPSSNGSFKQRVPENCPCDSCYWKEIGWPNV